MPKEKLRYILIALGFALIPVALLIGVLYARSGDKELSPPLEVIRATATHLAEVRKLESLRASLYEVRANIATVNYEQDARIKEADAKARKLYDEAIHGRQDDPDLVATAKRIYLQRKNEVADPAFKKLQAVELEFDLLPAMERDIAAQQAIVDAAAKSLVKLQDRAYPR